MIRMMLGFAAPSFAKAMAGKKSKGLRAKSKRGNRIRVI
jgi:hypothetical protein